MYWNSELVKFALQKQLVIFFQKPLKLIVVESFQQNDEVSIKNATTIHIKLRPMTYLLLFATLAIVASLLAAPALSASSNLCSPCHGTSYNQQLDILEGNGKNVIPTTIQVGGTKTVTVVIENINNADAYSQLSSVSLTLNSPNGHFTVNSGSYTVGTLSIGTATATWQITGVSEGADAIVISATARNTHDNLQFSDSYSPSSSITVSASPTHTPSPTPVPTSSPTASPPPPTNPTVTPTPTSNINSLSPTDSTPTATPKLNNPTPTTTPDAPAPKIHTHHLPWYHYNLHHFNHLHMVYRWIFFHSGFD